MEVYDNRPMYLNVMYVRRLQSRDTVEDGTPAYQNNEDSGFLFRMSNMVWAQDSVFDYLDLWVRLSDPQSFACVL